MLEQEAMIEKVRELCGQDERVAAALMYGSFAQGEGDQYSDVEFYLFFRDEALDEVNEEEWVARISPVGLYYVNEFGNGTAIFENLVRGEFHFEKASNVGLVAGWRSARFTSPESAVLLDRDGELSRLVNRRADCPPDEDTPEQARFLCHSLINWTLMGANLLMRGEHARALVFLSLVHVHLLRAARLAEGSTANWLSPSRRLEEDVSAATYARFRACTAAVEADGLARAYRCTWEWGRELMDELSERHAFPLPSALLGKLDRYFADARA